MKKILIVLSSVIFIFLTYMTVNIVQNKVETLEGTVVEKNDNSFMTDTEYGLMDVHKPDNFVDPGIVAGDRIKIYYRGGILEIYPSRFEEVVKIEKLS